MQNPPSCFDIITGDKTNNVVKFMQEFDRDVYYLGEDEAKRVYAWLLRNGKYTLLCALVDRISAGTLDTYFGNILVPFPVSELQSFVSHLYSLTDIWGFFGTPLHGGMFKGKIYSHGKYLIALSKKSIELEIDLDLHTDIGRHILVNPTQATLLIIANFIKDHEELTNDSSDEVYERVTKNLEIYTSSVFIMLDNINASTAVETVICIHNILREMIAHDRIGIKDYQRFIIGLDHLNDIECPDVKKYQTSTILLLIDGIKEEYLRRSLNELTSEGTSILTLDKVMKRLRSCNISITTPFISSLMTNQTGLVLGSKNKHHQTAEFYKWLIDQIVIFDHESFIIMWRLLNKVTKIGCFAEILIDKFQHVIEENYDISFLIDAIEISIDFKPVVRKKLLQRVSNNMIAGYISDVAMDLHLMPTLHRTLATEMVDSIQYMDEDSIKTDIINKYSAMITHYAMLETKEAILGLESLPALLTYLIACELSQFATVLPMYVIWNRITRVKHHQQKNETAVQPHPSKRSRTR